MITKFFRWRSLDICLLLLFPLLSCKTGRAPNTDTYSDRSSSRKLDSASRAQEEYYLVIVDDNKGSKKGFNLAQNLDNDIEVLIAATVFGSQALQSDNDLALFHIEPKMVYHYSNLLNSANPTRVNKLVKTRSDVLDQLDEVVPEGKTVEFFAKDPANLARDIEKQYGDHFFVSTTRITNPPKKLKGWGDNVGSVRVTSKVKFVPSINLRAEVESLPKVKLDAPFQLGKTYEIDGHRLTLGEQLGAGGFGKVYNADYDGIEVAAKTLSREAVKVMAAKTLIKSQNGIALDAAVLKNLDGIKGVPKYHGFYISSDGFPIVLMEKGIAVGNTAIDSKFVESVAGTLKSIHDRGIALVDIKPDNLLLDVNKRPIFIDLGSAWEIGSSSKRIVGTSEFYNDFDVGTVRGDTRALGITLLELSLRRNLRDDFSNVGGIDKIRGELTEYYSDVSKVSDAALRRLYQEYKLKIPENPRDPYYLEGLIEKNTKEVAHSRFFKKFEIKLREEGKLTPLQKTYFDIIDGRITSPQEILDAIR